MTKRTGWVVSEHPTLDEVRQIYHFVNYSRCRTVQVRDNWLIEAYANKEDPCGTWDAALEAGRGYLVGDSMPMARYLATHRSTVTEWQRAAFRWCQDHPDKMLCMEDGVQDWHICVRGDYVEFDLPYHDAGGERTYISQNGRSKIMVNED